MGSIQRYFIDEQIHLNDIVQLTEDQSYQISKVMRSHIGQELICISNQKTYLCQIIEINQFVKVEVKKQLEEHHELNLEVVLIYALPKLEKFEMVIQKATELGVSEIIPCLSKRSIIKLNQQKIEKKHQRWLEIIKEAAEQSHRQKLPELKKTIPFIQLSEIKADYLLVAYEEETVSSLFKDTLMQLKKGNRIAILIGPEGGFEPSEIERLQSYGFTPCGLGKRILRTETAAIFALSSIVYQFELN